MAFVLTYNSILQVLAAFVIFILGYVAFFALLIVTLLFATGLYEGAKWIRAYTVRSASATSSILYFSHLFSRLGGIGSFSSEQPGRSQQ
jgi:hypothetical protein